MKTVIALTTFAVASIAEKLFMARSKNIVQPVTNSRMELTDEIRRYDIDDLILS